MSFVTRGLVAAVCLSACGICVADEGMWMPRQVPEVQSQLSSRGFKGDAKAFANLSGDPMAAIVSLGGCSASFVSADGLIITNQHCVGSAAQYNSTPDRNILVDGYIAKDRGEELWAGPGSRASITVSMKDVTQEISGGIDPGTDDRKRFDIIERRSKERVKACEQSGMRCRVAEFFEGNRYFEIAQMEINDLRLVYVPAEGIGAFGGETDNWQWPRHTGDFAFYRAYVAKDGKPAGHAADNVPYRPKAWLKIDTKGVSPSDWIVVAGYPGSTRRLETHAEVERMVDWSLPRSIQRSEDQLAILTALAAADPEVKIKVATRIRGLNNGLTNNRGKLEGLRDAKLVETKASREKALLAWIASDSKRQKEFGGVLPGLDAITAEEMKTRHHDAGLNDVAGGSSLLSAGRTIYKLSVARPLPDLDREPAYQERNWSRITERQERLQKNLDLNADRAVFRYNLLGAAKLPEGSRIAALDEAVGLRPGMSDDDAARAVDVLLDRLYAGTKLADPKARLGFLEKSTDEVKQAKDPFIDLAIALDAELTAVEDREKRNDGLRSRLAPSYIKAMLEFSGGLLAPDANGSLRVTFGRVEGVAERDGLVYLPQTTLAGVVEKNQGRGDFNVPQRELDAVSALRAGKNTRFLDPKLKDVPVNFLASVDTTGGNSGSAAMNEKGQLIGLLFDGTFDTVASDVVFDPVRTRSILVDIRYVLWVMDDVDHVTRLLDELGVRARP